MHSSLAPNMEASLESKFSAAFEQQNSHTSSGGTSLGMKSGLLNGGGNHYHNAHHAPTAHQHHGHHKSRSHPVPATTTATPNTESSSGEKTVSFRKGNDLESFEALSSLYANGLFTDLVICCSGKMFKCHRVVMAAASLYIRDALSAFYNNAVDGNSGGSAGGCNNCNTVMILPKEIKMSDMEAILRFIYDGHVEVKVDAIESFLKSARMLNIKGLSNVNIVFNNNGSATDESVEDCSIEESLANAAISAGRKQNNGYSKNTGVGANSGASNLHHHSSLLNGHAGVNSPPPSPPSMNNSLASLKALAAASTNQTSSTPSAHVNGGSGKHVNGIGSAHHGVNFSNRGQFNTKNHREHQLASLRANQHDQHNNSLHQNHSSQNHSSSSILSHNLTPAHQSSTPKSIFANGNLFSGGNMRVDAASSIVPNASGSSSSGRRKQKFPTNIPSTFNLNDAIPPLAAALYLNPAAWLHNQSENDEDDDDVDESFEEKKLVIKDDSSNDCNSTGDNLSTASMDVSANAANKAAAGGHHNLGPFGQLPLGTFNPQMPCMIEVEADPTNFPTYCHDQNENMGQLNAQAAAAAAVLLQTASKQRRRHFKSAFPSAEKFAADLFNSGGNKKLKLPFGGNALNSPNSDLSIKPFSPMMTAVSHQGQQSSPVDLLTKKIHSGGSAAAIARHIEMENKGTPLFSAFSTVKTAAGANPSAGAAAGQSPSSVSSLPGSANWAGNKWKCDICNKYYGNKQTLKEHMDYFHSNREEQIYICNICNKEYTWRKSLMKHYRDIHQMRNTPALAEINRQLAALATTKGRSGMGGGPPSMASPMSGSDHSGHGSALQSYVSIANNMNRHHQSGGGKASSVGDELSRDIDCDGDASVDAVPEEEDEEDDSNEEVEVEAGEEHSSNGIGHNDESPSDDREGVNGSEGVVKGNAPDEEDENEEHHPMIVDDGAEEKEKSTLVAENSSNNSDNHSDASSAATVPENSSPVSSPPSFSS